MAHQPGVPLFHNKNSFLRSSLATAALLTLVAAAQAQASSYLLVGGGRSDFSLDCSGTSACDTSGSALQLVGGHRMASGWALEGLYVNFSKTFGTELGYLRTRGEIEGDKGDLSAITLSARFTF